MYNMLWKYKAMGGNNDLIWKSDYLEGLGDGIWTVHRVMALVMSYLSGKVVGGWVFTVLFIALCFILMKMW